MAFSAPENEVLVGGGFSAPDDEVIENGFSMPSAKAAERVVSAITPEVQGPPPKESFLQRLARGTRQMFFPASMDEVKSLVNPNLGQFGASKILEEEGKRLGAAVRGSTENIREKAPISTSLPGPAGLLGAVDVLSDSLTPTGFQQNIGAEGAGQAVVAPAIKGLSRGTSKVSELLTGSQSSNFNRLADDPAAILPEALGGSMSKKKAGALLGKAERDAGFVTTPLEPESGSAAKGIKSFEGKTSPFKGDQGIADVYFERVAKGEQLTPQEALEAYKSTSRTLAKMSRKDARYVEMLKFEKALGSELEAISPEYAAAKKNYARSAMGDATSNILPRTATGKVSQGRVGFNALIFGGGSIINPAALAGLALSSPLTHGITHAGLGAASKAISIPGLSTGFFSKLKESARKALERLESEKKTIRPVRGPSGGDSEKIKGKSLTDFVRGAKVGTEFTYQGQKFKVVPQPGRSKESLANLSPEERRVYYASKSRNRGANTFSRA